MLEQIQSYIDKGLIYCNEHPSNSDYKIYQYTKKCQFKDAWDDVTLNCRGLITRKGNVIARSPKKFMNYSSEIHPPLSEGIGFYEKVDGSLIIPYLFEREVYCATKGSFVSNQAFVATELLHEHDEFFTNMIQDLLENSFTPIFEVIYPKNQIVVNYGSRRELVYIGTVNNHTGMIDYETDRNEFSKFVTVVEKRKDAQDFPERSEGVVVQFSNQEVAKVKSEWYLSLHRLVANQDFYRMTLQSMIEDDIDSWFNDIPEEFASQVREHRAAIEKRLVSESKRLRVLFASIRSSNETDKEIALEIQEHVKDRVLLFSYWRKGQELLDKMILRQFLVEYNLSNNS